jgi:starch synthase
MDDGERFAYFAMAVVEMMRHIGFYPDILHAHDWSSALTLVYLNRKYRSIPEYANIRTVFTIHNIEYQGSYDFAILGDIFDLGQEDRSLMEYDGRINLMKAAIECADTISTVSPRYAEEILTPQYASGLQYILHANAAKLCGILNGIDYIYNDPENDPAIAKHYNARRQAGKYANKLALQKELGLPQTKEVPMLAIISRLASHKGLDLVTEIAEQALQDGVQLVVLGTGEARFEEFFRALETKYPTQMRALITYNRDLSKRIYAACDIFLMPSKSEPCGLSQMIASRYGAIPVTRETGGLYDSIKPYYEEDGVLYGNGFTFANYAGSELRDRCEAAIALYNRPRKRRALIEKIMNTDFSWSASANSYLAMYRSLL